MAMDLALLQAQPNAGEITQQVDCDTGDVAGGAGGVGACSSGGKN